MTALMVAFGSAARRHSAEEEFLLLRQQVSELRHLSHELQEKLRWTESRYAQFRTLGKQLNEALLAEQAKNRALTERLSIKETTPGAPALRLQQTPQKDTASSS